MQRFWSWCWCLTAVVSATAAESERTFSGSNALSLAEFHRRVPERERVIHSFRLEGVVRAALPDRKLIVLQDDSGAALLELPSVDPAVRPGDWLSVEGNHCAVIRNRFALQFGTAPVVDNNGNHPPILKAGAVFLGAGRQPVRLAWYNGLDGATLGLEWEGPGVSRQMIPNAVLWHKADGADGEPEFKRGLHFTAYVGTNWQTLPDFTRLKTAGEGIAKKIDLAYRVRVEETALVFDGYLEVPRTGVYLFHLNSDDGSQLFVGNPTARCEVVRLPDRAPPLARTPEQMLAEPAGDHWIELDGVVTFAGPGEDGLELELTAMGDRVRVRVIDPAALSSAKLVHRRVRISGISQVTHDLEQRKRMSVIVLTADQIQVRGSSTDTTRGFGDTVLTAAEQILRLKPDEAREKIRVKIRGVVTQASARSMVLQDPTAGIFVHYLAHGSEEPPHVGELWEIEGTTDPGDFSPVIRADRGEFLGHGVLPEPIRPNWDQLMNGSLDAQYVEIHGVVLSMSETNLVLLTPDGKLRILANSDHPMPRLSVTAPDAARRQSYVDSVVRIRGCLTAEWDTQTRRIKAGEIYINPGIISLEEPRLADPFALPTRRASDLLVFDARASALQPTKVAGQIIHAGERQFCLLDGNTGLRLIAKEPVALRTGDLVEAVGFPRLGGPAPVLQEALVRKVGSGALPAPLPVASDGLLDRRHDSTLVQVEALLESDSAQQGERILELQAGPHHFLARLNSGRQSWTPLAPGSRLQLTGVYSSAREDRAGNRLDSFEVWLNDAASIKILQQPPWWTVRRAVTMAAALAGGLGLALVWITLLRRKVEERTAQLQKEIEERQRIEQHRVMEQERTRVARDLHDELGAGLTEVGILGSLAKNPSIPAERKSVYLDQLTEAARSLVTGLDEIVWAVNPQYDSVPSLASYYSLFAQRFLNLAEIACRLEIAETLPEYPLDSRVRHGIFLAFKEALNNVVRHSGATEVRLKVEVAREQLMISITDNGRGFPAGSGAPACVAEASGSVERGMADGGNRDTHPADTPAWRRPGSDGLAGMEERMRKLGGDCRINSGVGRGTTVEFTLPLEKAVS